MQILADGKLGQIWQNANIQYDSHNRIERVIDSGGRFDLRYAYDGVGNVREVEAQYIDPLSKDSKRQHFWYAYDAMDRFTVSMGQLINGQIVGGTSGVELGYDYAGQRISARDARGDNRLRSYEYTADGYLETVKLDGKNLIEHTLDKLGRTLSTQEYDANSFAKTKLRSYEYLANNQIKLSREGETATSHVYNDDGSLQYTQTSGTGVVSVRQDYEYAYWDSARQKRISVSGAGERGVSSFEFDANGQVSKVTDQGTSQTTAPRVLRYVKNAQGQILHREDFTQGGSLLRYRDFFYADGRLIGDLSNDGPSREDYVQAQASQKAREGHKDVRNRQAQAAVDFDQNYEPIGPNYPGNAATIHTAQSGDSLRSIAQSVWGDAAMWYLLAEANGYEEDVSLRGGELIKIPNKVSNIHHKAHTHRVYNPGEAMGNTDPTLPEPPPPPPQPPANKSCNSIATVIMVVIAVVVTIYTAGAAAPAMASLIGGAASAGTAATVGAMGAAALAGGAATGMTVGVAMASAAVGAAVGSAVSQVAGMAMGVQDKFSWRAVGQSALGAGITAGVGGGLQTLGKSVQALSVLSDTTSYTRTAVAAMGSSMISQSLHSDSFSWRKVAASTVGALAGQAAGNGLAEMGLSGMDYEWSGVARNTMQGMASSWTAAATTSRQARRHPQTMMGDLFINSLGSALGSAVKKGVEDWETGRQRQPMKFNALEKVQFAAMNGWQPSESEVMPSVSPGSGDESWGGSNDEAFTDAEQKLADRGARFYRGFPKDGITLGPDGKTWVRYWPRYEAVADPAAQKSAAVSGGSGIRRVPINDAPDIDIRISYESSPQNALKKLLPDLPSALDLLQSPVFNTMSTESLERYANSPSFSVWGGNQGESGYARIDRESAPYVQSGFSGLGLGIFHAFGGEYGSKSVNVISNLAASMEGAGAIYGVPVLSRPGLKVVQARGAVANRGLLLQEPGSVDHLLYGARVGEGLPGSAGVVITRRPSIEQMINLSEKHGVEFSTVYTLGSGKSGGGGYYTLYSGGPSSVSVGDFGANKILINHTHPKGTASASGYWFDPVKNVEVYASDSSLIRSGLLELRGDQGVLQGFINAGSPQRSSVVIPGARPDGNVLPPFRFDVTSKNLDYVVVNGAAIRKKR